MSDNQDLRDHPIPFVLDHFVITCDDATERFIFATKGGAQVTWRDIVRVLRAEFPTMIGNFSNPFSYVVAHLHALHRAGEL